MLRAWRAADGFEGRSSVRSWLYRIATNICLDMLRGSQRRALPMDIGPAVAAGRGAARAVAPSDTGSPRSPTTGCCPSTATRPTSRWRGTRSAGVRDRAAAPARPAAGHADPVRGAEDARGRGRRHCSAPAWPPSTARCSGPGPPWPRCPRSSARPRGADQADLLASYVDAFQRYDMEQLVTLLHDDARDDDAAVRHVDPGAPNIIRWMQEPGPSLCKGLGTGPRGPGQRRPGVGAVQAGPGRRVTRPGRCRCTSCPATGSSG